MSSENSDNSPPAHNQAISILDPSASSKLKKHRRKTIVNNFISAIRKNNQKSINSMLSNKDLQSEKRKKKLTSEAIKSALENDNKDLVLSLKSEGFKTSGSLLLSVISEKNEKVLSGLIELGIYSSDRLHAYLWYLLFQGYENFAALLINSNEELGDYSGFMNMNRINLLTDAKLVELALDEAFISQCDDLAEKLIIKNPFLAQRKYIDLALENNCLSFLRVVSSMDSSEVAKSQTKSQPENLSFNNNDKNNELQVYILEFLNYYIGQENFEFVMKIIHWPEAIKHSEILDILIEHQLEPIAKEYVKFFEKTSTSKEFYNAFENQFFDLCLAMLSVGLKKISLHNLEFQKKLVDLIIDPEKCLLCIELLASINKKEWIPEITKQLCMNLQHFAKKTDNILYCQKPLLYCVKVIEFLLELSERNYEFRAKCFNISELYKNLFLELQDQIKGEEEIRYFILHEDSNGDSALNLIAKNGFIELLQNEDIGTIIEKYWTGAKHARSIYEASTIYNSFSSGLNNPDALSYSKRMIKNRNYSFQYEQWADSCSYRFYSQGLSAGLLVVLYQILVYRTFRLTNYYDIGSNKETRGYYRLIQIWIFAIIADQILHAIYVSLKKDANLLNPWRIFDIATFILMLLVSYDITGGYSSIGLSSSDRDDTVAGILLSLLMLVIWLRFASIVIVSKTYGQFLRIIYHMIGETLNFFIILLSLFICAAGVFTAVFYNSNPNFITFDISLRTVFADAMGGFDLTTYTDHKALGGSFEAFYLMISNVVLLNLLIAIISNVYENLVETVESEYRNVVITYIEKYQWDAKYGFLIYIPAPVSFAVLLFCPFVIWFSNEPEKWNTRICKIFYVIMTIMNFIAFNAIGLFYSIPLYFKGFFIYPMQSKSKVEDQEASESLQSKSSKFIILGRATIWFFIGLPLILWALIRDAFDFLTIVYKESEKSEEISESLKYDIFLTPRFIKSLQMTLDNIQPEEITVHELLEAWKLYDENDFIADEAEVNLRYEEIEDFFRQFLINSKSQLINVQFIKKMLPRVKGDIYDEEYVNRARYINIAGISKGIRIFHSNIGALNISGITIPKPEPDNEFDMERVNKLNNSIKELDELYAKLQRYSVRLTTSIEEPPIS